MRLVTFTRINRQYFAKGSRPSRAEWQSAIERGEVGGKVGMGKVWVDQDDFLARDFLGNQKPQNVELNLLD